MPVLIEILPLVSRPVVKSDAERPSLKWAIGNALDPVTTPKHIEALLDLALDKTHGVGRQIVVDLLGRISKDDRVGAPVSARRGRHPSRDGGGRAPPRPRRHHRIRTPAAGALIGASPTDCSSTAASSREGARAASGVKYVRREARHADLC